MADSSDCCKCLSGSDGPTLSTANTFTFQMCDGGQPVGVPASNIADYLVNVVYGDASGDPPDEGCYLVCYDSNGVQSIELYEETSQECFLNEPEFIFATDENPELWSPRDASNFLTFATPPPAGFTPTFAKLRFQLFNGSESSVRFYDVFNNLLIHNIAFNGDDDNGSSVELTAPVTFNGTNWGVELTHMGGNIRATIQMVSYISAKSIDSSGNITTPTGGITIPTITTPTPDPLGIPFLEHTCSSTTQDSTIIEWLKDTTLVEGTDDYIVRFDFGGNDIRDITVPHATSISSKQRLTVTWATDKALKIDAKVISSNGIGVVATSDIGVTDPLIVLAKDIDTQTA